LNLDYTVSPPAFRGLGVITSPIRLAQVLTLHAILAVESKQPDLALGDLRVNYIVLSGTKRDPTLFGGLVAIGVAAISNRVIYDGLADHAWSDAQLATLQRILSPINFLSDYQFDMRSEVAESVENLEYFKKSASLNDRNGLFVQAADRKDAVFIRTLPRWPDGWWDNNKSKMTNFLFQELNTVDPQTRLAFPNINSKLSHQVDGALAGWDAYAPWNIWFTISAPPLYNQTQKFAYAQVWIDEARIACGLERYRLAHGVYPAMLEALAPEGIDELPHDIMNCEAYHYRLNGDGTFLLYSVGWNQVDDGGKVVFKQDAPTQVDYEQGDWVWPVAKGALK
jgi:hypothetical protein